MTVAYRGLSSRAGGDSVPISLTNDVPGLANGDFMLMVIYANSVPATPPIAPAGWTLIDKEDGGSAYLHVYGKVAASEPGSYTINPNTGIKRLGAGLIVFYSTDGKALYADAHANQSNASSTNRTCPGVTTTKASAGLACFFNSATIVSTTPAAGMTERWDELLAGGMRAYAMTSILVAAGATGDKVATGASTMATRCVTVAVAETPLPPAPSGLDVQPTSSSTTHMFWSDNSSDELGFRIERSLTGVGAWTEIDTVGPGVDEYDDSGLDPETVYYYQVAAYNVSGNSAWSAVASAETLPDFLAPADLTATVLSARRIRLEWTDTNTTESGYLIEHSLTGVGDWVQVGSVGIGVETFTDTGLLSGTAYFYRVRGWQEI